MGVSYSTISPGIETSLNTGHDSMEQKSVQLWDICMKTILYIGT